MQSAATSYVEIEKSVATQLYKLHELSSDWPAEDVLIGIQHEVRWTVKGLVPLTVAQTNGFRRRFIQLRRYESELCLLGTWHTRPRVRSRNIEDLDAGPLHLIFDDDGSPQCFYGQTLLSVRIPNPEKTVYLETDILAGLRELLPNQDSDQGLLFGRRTTSSFVIEHAYPIPFSHITRSLDTEVLMHLQLSNKEMIGLYRLNTKPFPKWFYECGLIAIIDARAAMELTWSRGNQCRPIATLGSMTLPVLDQKDLGLYCWSQLTPTYVE